MNLKKISALFVILAALSAVGYFYWPRDKAYSRYISSEAPFVEFKYPKNWAIKRDKGKIEAYHQIMAIGPKNLQGTFKTAFIIREIPAKGKFKSLEDFKNSRLSAPFKNKKILEVTSFKIDGFSADSVTISYTIPPSGFHGLKPVPVEVQSKMVFVERDAFFYEITYTSDQTDFPQNSGAFASFISSFNFLAS